MESPTPSRRPWHVRTLDGSLHSGYTEEIDAARACEQINKQAEALGIQTRYKVEPRADAA